MERKSVTKNIEVGARFGRLVVTGRSEFVGEKPNRRLKREALCDCGKTTWVVTNKLTSGVTQSCGCLHKEQLGNRSSSSGEMHGLSHTITYKSWKSMVARCKREGNDNYHNYGGRGVFVCDRWLNSFPKFLEDVGERPSKDYSLGRIDNEGNYCPGNVRWETSKEQNNNKRSNTTITINDVSRTVTQWCEILNVPRTRVYGRLNAGWNEIEALTLPPGKGKKQRPE